LKNRGFGGVVLFHRFISDNKAHTAEETKICNTVSFRMHAEWFKVHVTNSVQWNTYETRFSIFVPFLLLLTWIFCHFVILMNYFSTPLNVIKVSMVYKSLEVSHLLAVATDTVTVDCRRALVKDYVTHALVL